MECFTVTLKPSLIITSNESSLVHSVFDIDRHTTSLRPILCCMRQVLNKQAVDVVCSTYEMLVADPSGFGSRLAHLLCGVFDIKLCIVLLHGYLSASADALREKNKGGERMARVRG
jgi:hypothetical protein